MPPPARPIGWMIGLLLAALCGCTEAEWNKFGEFLGWRKKSPSEQEVIESATLAALRQRARSSAVQDTIGAAGFLQGRRIMRVRGYGLVVGLGEEGSREVPRQIRDEMLQEMHKHHDFGAGRARGFDPEKLLDSPDTAVVLVSGEIAPASLKGARFDVTVRALPGSQTRSLSGGHLWRCDLRMYRETAAGSVTEGRALAYAEGPIYIEPFTQDEESPTRLDPRQGRIIGGGVTGQDREVYIELYNPSYQLSYQIAARINARFPAEPKVADAVSPGRVDLTIPRSFADDPDRFLEQVMHLYVSDEPAFLDRKARRLAEEIARADAPHDDIGLAWEGMGRNVLPTLRELYADPRPHVAYHAARTGLRLNDELAVEVLRRFAHERQSKYQPAAIAELGRASGLHRAAAAIRPLLADEDPRVRGWVYDALRKRGDRSVRSMPVGGGDFFLDIVDSQGPPMIRASSGDEPRLAVFAAKLSCRLPVFFSGADGCLTINASTDDDCLTVVRRWSHREGILSFKTSLDVIELIARLGDWPVPETAYAPPGAGLSYSQVVETLYSLCQSGTIEAAFVFEKPRLSDILRPFQPTGRPATDLD